MYSTKGYSSHNHHSGKHNQNKVVTEDFRGHDQHESRAHQRETHKQLSVPREGPLTFSEDQAIKTILEVEEEAAELLGEDAPKKPLTYDICAKALRDRKGGTDSALAVKIKKVESYTARENELRDNPSERTRF